MSPLFKIILAIVGCVIVAHLIVACLPAVAS